MDSVTQANASTAEQSASAAVQLDAQANALVNAVDRLSLLINGEQRSVAAIAAKAWARSRPGGPPAEKVSPNRSILRP